MWRRRRKWIILCCCAALLAGLALAVALLGRGVEKELAKIRSAGLPVTPAELDVWYRAVPEKENQAEVILQAAQLLGSPGKTDPLANQTGSLRAGQKLSPELQSALAATVQSNEEALALLHQAARLPDSRYPVNLSMGAATLLPHLAQVKSAAMLLRSEAVYESSRGQVDKAVASIDAGFALARSLRNEPLLISELVRLACSAITLQALERVLSEHPLSEKQLRDLSEQLTHAEEDGRTATKRAMVGERVLGFSAFSLSFAQLQQVNGTGGSSSSPGGELLQILGMHAYRLSGFKKRDMALYLDMMDCMVRGASAEFPAALTLTTNCEQEMQTRLGTGLGRFAVMSRMLLPSLTKSVHKEATSATRLRLAQAALAVERYRLEHAGALPESLSMLVPAYLFKVPSDPVSGENMALDKIEEGGYAIVVPGASPVERGLSKNSEELAFKVLR